MNMKDAHMGRGNREGEGNRGNGKVMPPLHVDPFPREKDIRPCRVA